MEKKDKKPTLEEIRSLYKELKAEKRTERKEERSKKRLIRRGEYRPESKPIQKLEIPNVLQQALQQVPQITNLPKPQILQAAPEMSFSENFSRNRKLGNKTFIYKGKEYTTELADTKPTSDKLEVEQPKVEQPKVEQPKVEQPKVEQLPKYALRDLGSEYLEGIKPITDGMSISEKMTTDLKNRRLLKKYENAQKNYVGGHMGSSMGMLGDYIDVGVKGARNYIGNLERKYGTNEDKPWRYAGYESQSDYDNRVIENEGNSLLYNPITSLLTGIRAGDIMQSPAGISYTVPLGKAQGALQASNVTSKAVQANKLVPRNAGNAITQGQVVLPQGQIALPQGQRAITQGQIALPQGQRAITQGQIALPQGQRAITQGQIAIGKWKK